MQHLEYDYKGGYTDMEKMEQEYKEYLRKYCTKHQISEEQAEQHYLVKEYRASLEAKYKGLVENDTVPSQPVVSSISCNCC